MAKTAPRRPIQTAKHRPIQAKPPIKSAKGTRTNNLRGLALLDDPARNKGTAFTEEERRRYGLEGLLPASAESLDRQVERVLGHLAPSRPILSVTFISSGFRTGTKRCSTAP